MEKNIDVNEYFEGFERGDSYKALYKKNGVQTLFLLKKTCTRITKHTKNMRPYQPYQVIKLILKIPSGLFQFSHSSPELHFLQKNCCECPVLVSSDSEGENETQQEAQEVEQGDINDKTTKSR